MSADPVLVRKGTVNNRVVRLLQIYPSGYIGEYVDDDGDTIYLGYLGDNAKKAWKQLERDVKCLR